MNWELAYQIVIGLGLILVGAWSFDARRLRIRILRLMQMQDGPPTEEIELPPVHWHDELDAGSELRLDGVRLEDLGPGKPMPQVPKRAYRNSW
jgi:hypothetical protein